MNTSTKTHRLFFALWPDEKTRQSIVETFSQFHPQKNARVLSPQDLHVTLHFLGHVTDETRHNMHLSAQKINSEKFVMNLDCFGYFSKAKIFYMGCNKPPANLLRLHQDLANTLEVCGYTSEAATYITHVSLMRKCAGHEAVKLLDKPPSFSIPWPVDEFVLVESQLNKQASSYRVIEHYPFSDITSMT